MSGILERKEAALATIAILVERLCLRDGVTEISITQADYDNIWQHTLMEGRSPEDPDLLLLKLEKRELS